MGKPKIYVPGQKNDFLDWARKMNLNASLDMKGGGANLNGASSSTASGPPSPALGKAVPQGMPQGTAGVQSAVSGVNTPVANSQSPAGTVQGTVGRAFDHAQGK